MDELKNVLLVTAGFFHPPYPARMQLHRTLAQMDGFAFQHISSLESLPAGLTQFSAIVLYMHQKKISPSALAALDVFVSSGGGLLGIHSATASFKETRHFFEILGGRFTGHGRVEDIAFKQSRSTIFPGIGNFVVKDELYLHELQPGITVHFSTQYHGRAVPVVWTYAYGQGRVCYAVPGHRTATLRNPSYQLLLQRGLQWVAG